MKHNQNSWINFLLQPGEEVSYEITRVIAAEKTEFQLIEILETKTFGRALFTDKKPQSSSIDHFIINEALVHPALTIHPHPKSVFIAGVGPGSSLKEILKHNTIEKVVVSDIDSKAIQFYKNYMHDWHEGAFDDKRVVMVIGDARKYLETTGEKFDCIFVDVSDPLLESPTIPLFTSEFYSVIHERLNKNGIFVTQAGRTNLNNLRYHQSIYLTAAEVFNSVHSYSTHYPFYAEEWGFVVASETYVPLKFTPRKIAHILARRGCENLQFYDGEVHTKMFTIAKCTKQKILSGKFVSTDENPLIVE